MANSKKISVILLLILVFLSTSAAESCERSIQIHENGVTQNQIEYTISPTDGYYYPKDGKWTTGIPRQAENIDVRDGDRDKLESDIEVSSNLNKRLTFWNDERVSDHEEYTFNITYSMPRGAILYENSIYLEQIIPYSSCEGETIIDHPASWNLQESTEENFEKKNSEIKFLENQDALKLWFKTENELTDIEDHQKGIFNLTAPSRYSSHILSQIEELSSYTSTLEEETGIQTPSKFHINYLPLNTSNISNEAAGQYYGGNIEIKSTQLSKRNISALEVLTHELVHGYNDKIAYGSPDWWWEEGNAGYVTHNVLEKHGYDTSLFRPSRKQVEATFENCEFERSFINDWSPVDEDDIVSIEPLFPCSDRDTLLDESDSTEADVAYITDRDRLGYEYSELIVSEIFANNSARVSDVYDLMQQKKTTFSNSTDLMNNQINYFASKATGTDLTTFLQERGIKTEPWQNHENKILDAEERLEELNSSYTRFKVFQSYQNDLKSIKTEFYQGRFGKTNEVSDIMKNAEERNKTAYKTLQKYNAVKNHILSLESQYSQSFYEEELRQLNESLDMVQDNQFKKARKQFNSLKEDADQKKEEIEKYEIEEEKLRSEIDEKSVFTSPFLFGAERTLAESLQNFEDGNLRSAQNEIQEVENKQTYSTILAIIFYLLLTINFGLVLQYRKKFASLLNSKK